MLKLFEKYKEYKRKAILWDNLKQDVDVRIDAYKHDYLERFDIEDLYNYRVFHKVKNLMIFLEGLKDVSILEEK
jgi:hypothetical protein